LNLLLGIVFIALGIYVKNLTVSFPWFLWLGLTPARFYSIDYFPLLPWFGVVLIGVFFGNSLYPHYTRNFYLHDLSKFAVIRFLTFLGRHSLLIYLIHQPVLIASLYLTGIVDGNRCLTVFKSFSAFLSHLKTTSLNSSLFYFQIIEYWNTQRRFLPVYFSVSL